MKNNKQITKLIYFHGLNSDAQSRKFLELKNFFEEIYDCSCIEWRNEDDISEIISETFSKTKADDQLIIVGDSTGANFAYQLREMRASIGKDSILILLSPLLDFERKLSSHYFPANVRKYLLTINDPNHAMIICSENDEILDQTYLIDAKLENVHMHIFEDTHRLEDFGSYLSLIKKYILFNQ